jgi:hypothetical protein
MVRCEDVDAMSRKKAKTEAERLRRTAQGDKEQRFRFWKRVVLISLIPLFLGGVFLLVRQSRQTPTSVPGPGYQPLVPAVAVGSAPINDVDPTSGKPVGVGSPTTIYKGYVIGFCCEESRSSGGWERKSEFDKDAFVRRFIKQR